MIRTVIVFLLLSSLAIAQDGSLPMPEKLIALNSTDGIKLLNESEAKLNLVSLMTYFECQQNPAYCGPASAACILNASGMPRPVSDAHGGYRLFTQDNFFIPNVEAVAPASLVRREGMSLAQMGDAMKAHGLEVSVHYAIKSTPPEFQEAVGKAMSTEGCYVVVNFLRSSLGQKSGGHFSPLGACWAGDKLTPEDDRYLLLDTSKYKYPPSWVRAKDLWDAMQDSDSASGTSRGYLVLSVPRQGNSE